MKKATYNGEVTVFVYDVAGRVVAEYSNQVQQNGTSYLTQDHLGSTRAVTDKDGAIRSRHDYFPFGEEVGAGAAGRTPAQGYSGGDNVRQKFTGYEQDAETGLDYAQARYFSPNQGRFSSVDPSLESAEPERPQTWNRYTYVLNNPLKFVDPNGLRYVQRTLADGSIQYGWCATDECYNSAIDSGREGYQGWTAVTFDESKSFSYLATPGIGGERYSSYTLRPDGTNGYSRILNGGSAGVTTDWNAQFAIGGLLKGAMSALGGLLDAAAGAMSRAAATEATTQVATQATTQAATQAEGAAAKTASTAFGRSIQSLKQSLGAGDGLWRRVAAHAEQAAGRAYRGGTSMEEVFVNRQTGERIIRHTVVRGQQVLHETFRAYGKFGK